MQINPPQMQPLNSNQSETYKLLISILFGLLGFIGAYFSIRFEYGNVYIIINWSLMFPLLIALAWGKRHGCIGILFGLTIFYPIFIGKYNGWASIVSSFSLLIWILIQGYGSEKRTHLRKFYTNIYFLQFVYIIIRLILYFSLFPFLYRFNPPFWNLDAYTSIAYSTISVFALKTIIAELTFLAVCDVLLQLPFIRKIFGLKYTETSRYNTRIVFFVTAFAMISALIVMTINFFVIDKQYSAQWLLSPSSQTLMNFYLAGILGLIFGGVLARIYQLQLETKEVVKEREKNYKLLFDKMMNGYFVLEPIFGDDQKLKDFRFTDVNPAFENHLSEDAPRDVLGKTWIEAYGFQNLHLEVYENILQTGLPQSIEAYYPMLNDSYYSANAFKISENKIGVIFENITERKKAEENLKELSADLLAIIESTSDNIWLVDENYQLRIFNKAFADSMEKYFGVDIKLGARGESAIPLELLEVWIGYYNRAFEEGHFTVEDTVGGTVLEVSFNPIYEDGGVAVFCKDITQRKLAEKQILALNSELEQRVSVRTAELQVAIDELQSFTYTVSHDLKSPLRAIDAYSRIMLEDYPQQMEGEIGEIATHIKNISRDMLALITKLLQYSTAASVNINMESVDLNELFNVIFHELASAMPDRNIKLIQETEIPQVNVDEILMKQVIYNFLSNAIKFTKNRDLAIIKVTHTIDKEEMVISINDNGVGFNMELSGKLFGIFQRLHTIDEFDGSGIGLATTQKIIQKHGGRTWILGKLDKGATAYFTLPLSKAQYDN